MYHDRPTLEALPEGTVIKAYPATHGRFPERKERTLIVLRGGWVALPTSHGQSRRKHFSPSGTNGFWDDVDLITEIRCLIRPGSEIEVLGQLSAAELSVLRAKVRIFKPSLVVNLV
jgi:hypothetical protein